MIVYRFAGYINVFRRDMVCGLSSYDNRGNYLSLHGGRINYVNYDVNVRGPRRSVTFNGKDYFLHVNGVISVGAARKGHVFYESEEGSKLDLVPELVCAYAINSLQNDRLNKVLLNELDYPERGSSSLLLCDLVSNRFVTCQSWVTGMSHIGDSVYGWDLSDRILKRYDLELNLIWSSPFPLKGPLSSSGSVKSWDPVEYKDSVIFYSGHLKDEITEQQGERLRQFKCGVLYCF